METTEKIDKKLESDKKSRIAEIKAEPNKWKRFWKWVWYLLTFVWVWCWKELRDWKTLLVFVCTMAVVGCEVWIPFILGLIFNNAYLLGVAATCEAFWLLPATPFIPMCIGLTILIKTAFEKKVKKEKRKRSKKK